MPIFPHLVYSQSSHQVSDSNLTLVVQSIRAGNYPQLTLVEYLRILHPMNTLETDIEVSADGGMKLLAPLPSWLRPGRNHVLLVMADAETNVGGNSGEGLGIGKTKYVCGGDACIASTRIPVWSLEQARRLGFSEAELLDAYPSLKPSDLIAAWDYVNKYTEEIEVAIRENEGA